MSVPPDLRRLQLCARLTPASSECEASEDSGGEAELEAASDPEDGRDLSPGTLLYKASKSQNLPGMAEALAHGAHVNMVNDEDEGKTALIQAVVGVSPRRAARLPRCDVSFIRPRSLIPGFFDRLRVSTPKRC